MCLLMELPEKMYENKKGLSDFIEYTKENKCKQCYE